VALGVFSLPGGERRIGRREGDRVVDLGLGASVLERGGEAGADHALADVELHLPFAVADYVDFYSSLHHAANVGRMFRPDAEPLPPNWRHLPIGYHGRAGTVVPSGTPIRRPHGQRAEGDFGPTRRLDVELELGFVIGTPSRLGEPVPIGEALDHVFGVVLLNDWSARDLQAWEYRPLGPFLAKSFATSISHWVVPLDELPRTTREPQDPPPLPYLAEPPWAFDLPLELELNGTVIARSNARFLYWSVAQQIAHLTSNGATLRVGDLLGTGTISGPERDQRGCLLEMMGDGTIEGFLADGDEVVLRGEPLGEVRGVVTPAS
jgi:fumarylacetoacetase